MLNVLILLFTSEAKNKFVVLSTMKSIRTGLNLTQRELAELIGTTHGTICLYEKGLRSLPAKAALKLAQLQLLMQQASKQKAQLNSSAMARQQARQAKAEKWLHANACRAAADAVRIAHQLSRMQERYQLFTQKLATAQQLLQVATPGTRQMSFLENLELTILDMLDECGPARQAMLQYQLLLLKATQQAATATQIDIQQQMKAVKKS